MPSKCRDKETGLSVAGWASQVAKIYFFKFYIAIYKLLNIDRVISKVDVRDGSEAGTIHRWFTGVLLLN